MIATYTRFSGLELLEVDMAGGITDIDKLKAAISSSTAGVIVQNPNFFGIIEDIGDVEKIAHENKAMLIVNVLDPISLGILKNPGELGGIIPSNLLRDNEVNLPEVSEVDAVRHFTLLSNKNFGVYTGFYPLGSCTMKAAVTMEGKRSSFPIQPMEPIRPVQP